MAPTSSVSKELFVVLFALAVAIVSGDTYSFKETSRFTVPQCSVSNTFLCSDSFGVSMLSTKNGLVVNHQHGFSFLDNSVYPPRLGQQYSTLCPTLSPIGEDAKGNILFSHDNSPQCICNNPGDKPCVPQAEVVSPASISGFLSSLEGINSRRLSSIDPDFNASAVFVLDSDGKSLACSALTNGPELNGNIAFVSRGACSFQQKVTLAQNAGAVAVIIVNTQGAALSSIAVTSTIPVLFISYEDGFKINSTITNGTPVTIKMGSHTGDLSTPGNHSVGLLSFPPSVYTSQGPADGHSNTNIFQSVNAATIDVSRNQLWISNPDSSTGLIQVYDLANLNAPVLLMNFTQANLPTIISNSIARSLFSTIGTRHYMIISLYVDASVIVLDVTNLSATFVVKQYNDVVAAFVASADGGRAPEIIYAAGANLDIIDSVHVYNISNPSNSSAFTTQAPPQVNFGTNVVDISALETKLYVAYGSDGLFLYDISSPTFPNLLAYMKTVAANGTYTSGVLQVYAINQSAALILNFNPPSYSLITYGVTVVASTTTTTTSSAPVTTTTSSKSTSTTSSSTASHTICAPLLSTFILVLTVSLW